MTGTMEMQREKIATPPWKDGRASVLLMTTGAHEYFRELPGPKISSEWSLIHLLLLTSPVSAALVLA